MNKEISSISELFNAAYLLTPELIPKIKSEIEKVNKKSWAYFAPFLLSYNLYPKRSLYCLEIFETLIIFQHLKNSDRERIDFVLPPILLNSKSLHFLDTLCNLISNQFNQKNIRIIWADDLDKGFLEEYFGNRISVEKTDQEYIYDINAVIEMKGSDFRDLRKSVNKIRKLNPVFKEMGSEDLNESMDLLKNWRKVQGRKNNFLLDWGYTRKALMIFSELPKEDLYSWCIRIDNKMVGFAMAGPITKNVANFFVIKTDIDVSGLSLYLRWRVLKELRSFLVVNDASDLGIKGLKQHKMKLRPCEFNTTYTLAIIA